MTAPTARELLDPHKWPTLERSQILAARVEKVLALLNELPDQPISPRLVLRILNGEEV